MTPLRLQTLLRPQSLLRPQTLDAKLKAAVVITTLTALVLSLAGTVAYQLVTTKSRLVRELEILADVVGANGGAALAFQDPEAGERILSSLEAEPHILAGDFFTSGGAVLASFRQGDLPEVPEIDSGYEITPTAIVMVRGVSRQSEKVGRIRIISSLEPLYDQLRGSVTTSVAVFLGCALLALWVGYHWMSLISRPIHSLVVTAADISQSRDYSLRALKYEDDELGRLTDGFNHMLRQIERSDRDLQHANQELARSNSDLERFAYVASHDLQEPLRIVTSYSELLEDALGEELGQDARKYLDYVVSASQRMRTMINALLDYSRVGTRPEGFAPCDCDRALDGALENLHLAIGECGAEVTRDVLPQVTGDLHQLTLLFQNLIGNALKFRRDGTVPRIHVSCADRDDRWELRVADNGIGMDPDSTAGIFEVFHRLHSRTEYPGTGIGLAICRRIAERHDGEIRVESTLGEGSAFYVTLPKSSEVPRS